MATSKMQIEVGNLLDKEFPQFRIRENFRPDWFISSEGTRLELDFYIEEIKIAFEIQGEQHFSFIPFFHKDKFEFEKRKIFDQEKKDLCYGNDVRLFEICTKTDALIAISEIKEKFCEQPKYFYSYQNTYKKEKSKRNPDGNVKQRKTAWNATDEAAEKRMTSLIEKVRQYEAGEIFAEPERVERWRLVIQNNGHLIGD